MGIFINLADEIQPDVFLELGGHYSFLSGEVGEGGLAACAYTVRWCSSLCLLSPFCEFG
jgi:hypothetical protein